MRRSLIRNSIALLAGICMTHGYMQHMMWLAIAGVILFVMVAGQIGYEIGQSRGQTKLLLEAIADTRRRVEAENSAENK